MGFGIKTNGIKISVFIFVPFIFMPTNSSQWWSVDSVASDKVNEIGPEDSFESRMISRQSVNGVRHKDEWHKNIRFHLCALHIYANEFFSVVVGGQRGIGQSE